MAMTQKPKRPLVDRLADEARILRAAAALMDGRLSTPKQYRYLAQLMDEAVMFISGVEADRKMRGGR